MLTTVFDSFGYWRLGNTVAARRPINRISRLTTTDRTGRLMKISVMAIADHPGKYALDRVLLDPVRFSPPRLAPSRALRLVTLGLVARRLCRNRRQRIGRDHNGRTRLQLELADGHDTVARLQSLDDFGTSLDPVAGLHEGAHRRQAGLAVILLLLGGELDGIAIE